MPQRYALGQGAGQDGLPGVHGEAYAAGFQKYLEGHEGGLTSGYGRGSGRWKAAGAVSDSQALPERGV